MKIYEHGKMRNTREERGRKMERRWRKRGRNTKRNSTMRQWRRVNRNRGNKWAFCASLNTKKEGTEVTELYAR